MRKNCINFFQTTDGVFEIFWGCPSPCSASGLSCWVVTSENIKTKKRIFFSFGIMTRLLLSSSNAIQIHDNYSIKVSERKQTWKRNKKRSLKISEWQEPWKGAIKGPFLYFFFFFKSKGQLACWWTWTLLIKLIFYFSWIQISSNKILFDDHNRSSSRWL